MKTRFLFLLLISFVACKSIPKSKQTVCKSDCFIPSRDYQSSLAELEKEYAEMFDNPSRVTRYWVQFVIVKDRDWGLRNIDDYYPLIETELLELNTAFAPASIQFDMEKEVRVLENPEDITLEKAYAGKRRSLAFLKEKAEDNVITVYVLPTKKQEVGGISGFVEPAFCMGDKHFRPECSNKEFFAGLDTDYVCISGKTLGNRKTMIHEFGHFFGLLHTFGEKASKAKNQLVDDKSTCETSGDFICDTPVDPNMPKYVLSRKCQWWKHEKDKHGQYYAPLVNNYMSYYTIACDYAFTPDQIDRMKMYSLLVRSIYLRKHEDDVSMK